MTTPEPEGGESVSNTELFCPFCDSWMDGSYCECGKSRREVREEQKKLNREANRRMGIDEAVIDEPWGHR